MEQEFAIVLTKKNGRQRSLGSINYSILIKVAAIVADFF